MGGGAGEDPGVAGAPSRLKQPGTAMSSERAVGGPSEPADSSSRRDSDNGSWEFSMLNGTLRMGSAGDALKTDSSNLSGEFAGLLMLARSRSVGNSAAPGNSGSVAIYNHISRHRGGGSGGRGSIGLIADRDGMSPAAGHSSQGLVASRDDGDDEGCEHGGEEEKEEEGEEREKDTAAWHSLEATPLTDTVTGKKVRCSAVPPDNWLCARLGRQIEDAGSEHAEEGQKSVPIKVPGEASKNLL